MQQKSKNNSMKRRQVITREEKSFHLATFRASKPVQRVLCRFCLHILSLKSCAENQQAEKRIWCTPRKKKRGLLLSAPGRRLLPCSFLSICVCVYVCGNEYLNWRAWEWSWRWLVGRSDGWLVGCRGVRARRGETLCVWIKSTTCCVVCVFYTCSSSSIKVVVSLYLGSTLRLMISVVSCLYSQNAAPMLPHTPTNTRSEKNQLAHTSSASLHTHLSLGKLCPTQSRKLFFFASSLACFGVRLFCHLVTRQRNPLPVEKKHSQMTIRK